MIGHKRGRWQTCPACVVGTVAVWVFLTVGFLVLWTVTG